MLNLHCQLWWLHFRRACAIMPFHVNCHFIGFENVECHRVDYQVSCRLHTTNMVECVDVLRFWCVCSARTAVEKSTKTYSTWRIWFDWPPFSLNAANWIIYFIHFLNWRIKATSFRLFLFLCLGFTVLRFASIKMNQSEKERRTKILR